jgi:hypothetical protein
MAIMINPIFIGGLDRSGKTYLRFMLESHPEVIFSKRTNLWPKYYKKFGALDQKQNLDAFFLALAKNKHLANLDLDFVDIKRKFKEGLASYERAFELVHQQLALKNNKSFWGDQTEFLEFYAEEILNAYPSAKFIQVIRDPRDRFEAILTKQTNNQSLGLATARWVQSAKLAQKFATKFPESYLVVCYEELVADPEKTMKQVCEFLGIRYDSSLISLENVPRFKDFRDENNKQKVSPISTKFVGRFKKNLSPEQIDFIQKFSQPYLKQFNYQPVQIEKEGIEQIGNYIFTWPVQIIELLGGKILVQMGRV